MEKRDPSAPPDIAGPIVIVREADLSAVADAVGSDVETETYAAALFGRKKKPHTDCDADGFTVSGCKRTVTVTDGGGETHECRHSVTVPTTTTTSCRGIAPF
jgi:hypothetical protein